MEMNCGGNKVEMYVGDDDVIAYNTYHLLNCDYILGTVKWLHL